MEKKRVEAPKHDFSSWRVEMNFEEKRVEAPKHDCDVVIVLPGGKELTVQLRPSNADINYNGSLDIVLPGNDVVTMWQGDEMQPAPPLNEERPHIRVAKQIVTQLPGNYS